MKRQPLCSKGKVVTARLKCFNVQDASVQSLLTSVPTDMKRQIIITDLTRFNNDLKVCTAGIDYNTMECIRPLPYITRSSCDELSILPGGILSGDFEFQNDRGGPHKEDCRHGGLKYLGACSSEAFREVLEATCYPSVAQGFNIELLDGDRGVPVNHSLDRSIISLQVDPTAVFIDEGYKQGTLKLRFQDPSGRGYRNFPITDLGFHKFAQSRHHSGDLAALNDWIHNQAEVFLRIGLSGAFQPPEQKNAYWMQANGIYTFPEAPPGIRKHA